MPAKSNKPSTKKSEAPRLSRGRTQPGALFPVPPPASSLPESYAATLQEIKAHLRNARIRAVLAANPIVIEAYWHTGKIILARQKEAAWGARVIDRLAADLKEAFPDMSGLSPRNLLAMKVFAREFPDGPIAQQAVAQLPWGHVLQLLQRLKDPAARDFYIRETLAHGFCFRLSSLPPWPNIRLFPTHEALPRWCSPHKCSGCLPGDTIDFPCQAQSAIAQVFRFQPSTFSFFFAVPTATCSAFQVSSLPLSPLQLSAFKFHPSAFSLPPPLPN